MILNNPKFLQTNKVTSGNYSKQIFIFKHLEVFGKHQFSSEAYKEQILMSKNKKLFCIVRFPKESLIPRGGATRKQGRRDAQAWGGRDAQAGRQAEARRAEGRGASRRQGSARA